MPVGNCVRSFTKIRYWAGRSRACITLKGDRIDERYANGMVILNMVSIHFRFRRHSL